VREPLVHVYDGPNPKNVDLAAVLRAAVCGSAESPASVRGARMGGLVEAEVPFRVRMAPDLWLGLAAYELTVPDLHVVPVRQFLAIRQMADRVPDSEGDAAVFVPEAVHVYEGPRPVWVDFGRGVAWDCRRVRPGAASAGAWVEYGRPGRGRGVVRGAHDADAVARLGVLHAQCLRPSGDRRAALCLQRARQETSAG
jgi:hypothetical protein